jgi:type I restriction enzyme, S subunit
MEAVVYKTQKYPAYKDSGIDWLGEIPEHWELRRVKYLFKEINERSFDGQDDLLSVSQYTGVTKKADNIEEGDLLTNASSLEGYKKVRKGELVSNIMLAWNGSLGFSPFNGITSPAYSVYRLEGNCSKQYFHYLLRSEIYKAEFKRNSSGVIESRLRLYTDDFFRIRSLFPPLIEQTSIASFLDRQTALIDKAIGIKEKQIKLLKERRQIIIHKAVTRGLNPNVKMKESGVDWIGEIPEHWVLVKNRSLFHERNEPGNDNLPLLSISIHSAVSSEELEDDANLRGKIKIENKSSYKLVKVGDIAFNMMRAWQGAIGAVRVEGMVSPAYIVAKPRQSMNSDYFEYQFRTKSYIQQMDLNSKGITDFRKRLYWNEFKQLVSILPPYSEQEKISLFISTLNLKIDKAISSKEKEIEKLKEYKATLINSAVTGRIKVC